MAVKQQKTIKKIKNYDNAVGVIFAEVLKKLRIHLLNYCGGPIDRM